MGDPFIRFVGVRKAFGAKIVLAPFNLALQLMEYAAKTVSLGMRLFGNMFAGELVFMLIALLGATATWWGFGLHFLTGLGWSIFHILIGVLQANRAVMHINPWNYPVKAHTYDEYEEEFRDIMKSAGLPVEKE